MAFIMGDHILGADHGADPFGELLEQMIAGSLTVLLSHRIGIGKREENQGQMLLADACRLQQ